jgi:hypothetical protein
MLFVNIITVAEQFQKNWSSCPRWTPEAAASTEGDLKD